MKTCKKCNERKSLDDFYGQPNARDGRMSRCKECCKVAATKNRWKNIDRVREYDRNRPNAKERNELNKAYAKSPKGKRKSTEAKKRWVRKNQHKKQAHHAVTNAMRDGRLKRQPCEKCGAEDTQAHHEDYSKPLAVNWLCVPCHAAHHRSIREKERQNQ